MKALVTGGAGFIGSNLALHLQKLNWEVKVLDDFSAGSPENLKGFQQQIVKADLFSIAALFPDWYPEIIFHQAGITDTTFTNIETMRRVNVDGFRKVLRFANRKEARLVYASSAGVYGNGPVPMREKQQRIPLNVYAATKVEMENLATEYAHAGGSVIGLRYFNVYGPKEQHKIHMASMVWKLATEMAFGKLPCIFRWGEQERDQIYVTDVVRANVLAAQSGINGIFNIGTGRAVSFNEIVLQLANFLGCSSNIKYFDNPYSSYQSRTQADMKMAGSVLQFSAKYDFASGIKDYFQQVDLHRHIDLLAANTR